jgi:hypothetical protein
MILRKAVLLLAAVVAVSATLPVQAQLAAYGTVTVNRLSSIKGSPVATGLTVNDNVTPLGGLGGIYYDFLKLGPVKLGVDLRGSITSTKRGAYTFSNGGGAHLYSALGGVRAVFHTPFLPLRPYLQASAGLGRTDYGVLYSNGVTVRNNFQYMGYAGLDITVLPIVDFRVVELGYGGLNPMGTNGHNYPIESVSSGLVFHLPF